MSIENMNSTELLDEELELVDGGRKIYCTIQKHDTLIKLANRYNTTVDKLCELNGITDPDLIILGKKLRIK